MIALNEDECWTSVGVRHGRALLLAACPVPVRRIENESHPCRVWCVLERGYVSLFGLT